MKFWIAILPLLLASACMVTDGEERLPTPTATSTQIMEMSAAEVQLDGEGRYFIPDRGDGCAYEETGRTPEIAYEGGVLAPRVSLFATGCPIGWDYEPSTGKLWPLVP